MTQYDYPNRQALGLDPPWVGGESEPSPEPQTQSNPLDEMTKAELIEEASVRGIDVMDTATKAEIREALR